MDTENSLDANALLSELDKGLRSSKMGEECEAIVRFPWLFARYPFPILINSACLKLAEVFRNGSNFARLLILKVFQQSDKHLEKILNLDEFVRRIYNVTYSNDPIARALTLRALGSIASVIAQRKNIHHSIRDSLESSDEIEVQAAIEAAALFSKRCPEFALSIYPKILSMLNSPTISLQTRISLMSVLHHQHYNGEIASDVRKRCLNYLSEYPDERFLDAILHTLTYISVTSLNQIPEQIQLLLTNFRSNKKRSLRICMIRELQTLAKHTPHLWTKKNVEELIDICDQVHSDSLLFNFPPAFFGLVNILKLLLKCPCLLASERSYVNSFYERIFQFCVSLIERKTRIKSESNNNNVRFIVCIALSLLTQLSIQFEQVRAQVVSILKQQLLQSSAHCLEDNFSNERNMNAYRRLCICVVEIANLDRIFTKELVNCVECLINDRPLHPKWLTLLCETLCSIRHKEQCFVNSDQLGALLTKYGEEPECDENALCKLYTLYFQVMTIKQLPQNYISPNILDGAGTRSAWFFFKLGRQAMRYGHNQLCKRVFERLHHCAGNENMHFWIVSLLKISEAECCLSHCNHESDFERYLLDAIAVYTQAISHLKAAVTPGRSLQFAIEYVRLRSCYLQTHLMLIKFCKLLRTSPAASTSNLIALNSRDDLLRCGPIVIQMRQNGKDFRRLAQEYSELYQTSFNADHSSLVHLQLLQHCCTIVAEAVEAVFQTNRLGTLFITQEHNQIPIDQVLPEHRYLWNVCSKISEQVKKQIIEHSQPSGAHHALNAQPGSMLKNQVQTLLEISRSLVIVPQTIPRFFFQHLQNSCIKLAISPQAKPGAADQAITITANVNFAMKVEGVIVHSNSNQAALNPLEKPEPAIEIGENNQTDRQDNLIRRAAKILLQVNSQCTGRPTVPAHAYFSANDFNRGSVSLQSIVEPHNDYFQAQFLLALCSGLHQVTIEAFIIDEADCQWKTGPQMTLSVRVLE